jgi:DNA invertase Pin-like site-specific DNA recombinase
MKIGYARVATDDQNLSLQLDALQAAGCEKIFKDQLSGATAKRPGLDQALAAMQPGDVLTVWRLDRLGRNMRHLVETVTDLAERSIGFQSITEAMDTTTAGGELLFHIMGALAQFERRLNAERSRAGIEAARRRGKHLGRPADLTPEKVAHARKAIDGGEQSVTGMAKLLDVHRVTLHRGLRKKFLHEKTRVERDKRPKGPPLITTVGNQENVG